MEGLTSELSRDPPSEFTPVVFEDVTDKSGITFRHFTGRRSSQLPEDMGSGAAWVDFDNDGWLDLFVVNIAGSLESEHPGSDRSEPHHTLYRNKGNGTFEDVTEKAGLDISGWGMATAWGDYDNDGWKDVVITHYGLNRIFQNNGDGTFTEKTAEAGFDRYRGFWAGASWGDYNRDGYLDLYITGYVKYEKLKGIRESTSWEEPPSINPSSFRPERNLLFLNDGSGGFSEVAEVAGVANTGGRSLSAAWCDFDGDSWPDLYVANDVSDNVFYHNRGDGTFEDISHAARVADYRGAMGIAVGDWNRDRKIDLFITHWIAQENALYSNISKIDERNGKPPYGLTYFTDESARFGLGQSSLDYVGWATSFFDYDLDGRLDIFIVNGSTLQDPDSSTSLVGMNDQLYWNAGNDEGFFDVSSMSGSYFSREYVGRGAAIGDYDNDGDLDIFVVNHNGPGVLLRNTQTRDRHWLKVELRGNKSNSDAVGTRLELIVGSTVWIKQVGSQSSYLSQNSLIQHFGLGDHASVDTLKIWWPSGQKQILTQIETNQLISVEEHSTVSVETISKTK
ncbi:MAG: CRTAC1 family protein [Balneolaceae bacterium]|nr:CRTAC1 family protein [Balneolaceae bacterium]